IRAPAGRARSSGSSAASRTRISSVEGGAADMARGSGPTTYAARSVPHGAEHEQRVRVEFGRLVGHQRAAGDGVEGWYGLPALRVAGLLGGEGERDGLTALVEEEEERLVAEPLAARVLAANAVAPQQEAEGEQPVLFPVARRHLAALRVPPHRSLDALRVRLAGEEVAAAERGVRPAEGEGLADEIEEGRLALVEVPVVPVDLVVLAVGVVVAALRL